MIEAIPQLKKPSSQVKRVSMPCLQKLIFTDGFQGCDSSEGGLPSGCPQNSGRRTSFIVKVREGFLEEVVWDERGCFEI